MKTYVCYKNKKHLKTLYQTRKNYWYFTYVFKNHMIWDLHKIVECDQRFKPSASFEYFSQCGIYVHSALIQLFNYVIRIIK